MRKWGKGILGSGRKEIRMEQAAFVEVTPAGREAAAAKQRFELLSSVGIPWRDAVPAALDPCLDVAAVAELVERGCAPQTALSIIA